MVENIWYISTRSARMNWTALSTRMILSSRVTRSTRVIRTSRMIRSCPTLDCQLGFGIEIPSFSAMTEMPSSKSDELTTKMSRMFHIHSCLQVRK